MQQPALFRIVDLTLVFHQLSKLSSGSLPQIQISIQLQAIK